MLDNAEGNGNGLRPFRKLEIDNKEVELKTTSVVPDAVMKFCDQIDRNFATTADKLEATAHKLHGIADGLLDRARQLREAAPQVSKDVHDWIGFEQESIAREKFFRPLTD